MGTVRAALSQRQGAGILRRPSLFPKQVPMAKPPKIRWLKEPEDHDYPAAASYLALLLPDNEVKESGKRLRTGKMTAFKAKDIFRASGLSLLGVSNSHVEIDQEKIHAKKKLSPLL